MHTFSSKHHTDICVLDKATASDYFGNILFNTLIVIWLELQADQASSDQLPLKHGPLT